MHSDSKAHQRRILLARRAALTPAERLDANARLVEHLARVIEDQLGPLAQLSIAAYLPIGSEPDISALFAQLGAVALPAVVGSDQPLRFLQYVVGAPLQRQALGVWVPEHAVDAQPQLILAPCVGYHVRADGRIDRLGYGGGFYDRTLAAQPLPCIGVAYHCCRLAHFEPLPWDRPLHHLVTERGLALPQASHA